MNVYKLPRGPYAHEPTYTLDPEGEIEGWQACIEDWAISLYDAEDSGDMTLDECRRVVRNNLLAAFVGIETDTASDQELAAYFDDPGWNDIPGLVEAIEARCRQSAALLEEFRFLALRPWRSAEEKDVIWETDDIRWLVQVAACGVLPTASS